MSETASTMLELGTIAPYFNLPDVISGKNIALNDLKVGKALVIMFICNHCPYVQHILPTLLHIIGNYQEKNIQFVAINSNDVIAYPEDNPANMRQFARQHQFIFPYLFDETQAVAKAYHAACTPDFFVFAAGLACVYRGRFDDATPKNNRPVTGKDLTQALDCILQKQPIPAQQFPSLGCNIKWKR